MKKVTIILPVSRDRYIDAIFARLELMECDRANTNLLVIVDGKVDLFVKVRNLVEMSKFSQRLCIQFKSKHTLSQYDRAGRRLRISDIHNTLKSYIKDCDYVFGIEDDTIFKTNALEKLLKNYAVYPYAGIIEGVQIGRHGIPHIGAWKVDDPYNPSYIQSMLVGKGIEEIDAGGFYCFMTTRDNYVNHTFKPLKGGNELGPDVDYGFELRKLGFMNYIDWSVDTIHKTTNGDIHTRNTDVRQVKFRMKDNRWRQAQI